MRSKGVVRDTLGFNVVNVAVLTAVSIPPVSSAKSICRRSNAAWTKVVIRIYVVSTLRRAGKYTTPAMPGSPLKKISQIVASS